MKHPLLAAVTGLIIPGAGHALVGKPHQGAAFQLTAIGLIVATCLMRLITLPWAITALLICLALLHLSSASHAWHTARHDQTARNITGAALFCTASLTIAASLFYAKAFLLGVNLYYIPSQSMQPTLQPGDIILVDTWAYTERSAEVGDIATFHDPLLPQRTLIKRVAELRTDGPERLSIFFKGDNADHSSDSRYFGWIPGSTVTGRYVCTLPCWNKSL